jgi:hypothetical protein
MAASGYGALPGDFLLKFRGFRRRSAMVAVCRGALYRGLAVSSYLLFEN